MSGPNSEAATATKPFQILFSQVATSLGTQPFQLGPVISGAYNFSHWLVATSYDFQSLSFEASSCLRCQTTEWQWGIDAVLIPELRGFSWKLGPWISKQYSKHSWTALLQMASITTLGYGLWSDELKASSDGRAWLLPFQLKYAYALSNDLSLGTSFEQQFSIKRDILKNRSTWMFALKKDF